MNDKAALLLRRVNKWTNNKCKDSRNFSRFSLDDNKSDTASHASQISSASSVQTQDSPSSVHSLATHGKGHKPPSKNTSQLHIQIVM